MKGKEGNERRNAQTFLLLLAQRYQISILCPYNNAHILDTQKFMTALLSPHKYPLRKKSSLSNPFSYIYIMAKFCDVGRDKTC